MKLFRLAITALAWFMGISLYAQSSDDEARLLRFPATDGKQVVFSYSGDLYSVSIDGGIARKMTDHEGYEMFPRFSADGRRLAFTAQYDGNTEVYVMPAEGGVPKRITYTATLGRDDVSDRMGPNNIVMTWKNKTDEVVFRSRMISFNDFTGQLYAAGLDGDVPEQIPVPRGGFCSFSPDDGKMAYNRVFREFRTWKRYRGGMADDIWVYDFKTKKTENITNHPAQDIIPMWVGNKIFFLSDRDSTKHMNLYEYDITTKSVKAITHYTEYDIKFPSSGHNHIVFEYGGYIYKYDMASGKPPVKLTVYIKSDYSTGRGGVVNVSGNITTFEIAPDGNRALFGARGDIFTVPVKYGPTRNLTQTPGVHERNPKWSPDGKWIAYLSDRTGENEIYIQAQDGSGEPVPITRNADTYYYALYWSPDSKKILWADKKLRLRYVDIETKKVTEVDQAKSWEFTQYTWSPDSRWIAYVRPETEGMNRIYLYALDQKKAYPVTEEWYASYEPAFSNDGKYLVLVSNRDFNPIYSWTEWNHAYQDMSRVYLIVLSKATDSPFKPLSDEVQIKKEEEKKADKKEETKSDKSSETVTQVDIDGIVQRMIRLPVTPADYYNLSAVNGIVYYIRSGSKDEKPLLFMYDLKEKKETELGQINSYELSADGKKMIVAQNRTYAIIDLPKSKIDIKDKLNLSGMEMKLNRQEEWAQIYNECWRQMRDFLYAPNMHGVNWDGMRKKYEPLLKHVNHRNDLTYLIGELIGELNVGHAYVGGGDRPAVQRLPMGLLGAKLQRDKASRFYRITRILKGENWNSNLRSPLTEIGVDVKEGDYITAVNGQLTSRMDNIFESLVNTAGKQVVLRVNSKPSDEGSRTVTVVPIDDEAPLYYFNWVRTNVEKVAQATGGEVGYVHVPDMGPNGLNEFVKQFYPQLRKKALIVDVRGNGGGNVSPMLIERLRRELAMFNMYRNSGVYTNPREMLLGPMVCLLDEFSASDGDLFPYRFKKHKLGTLIGKRSWGGVVGIRGSLPLLDGGYLNRPEFAPFSTDGNEWIIEGHGVDPDIYVDNEPGEEFAGNDQQLNKAIEEILKELKTKKQVLPDIPEYPKK